MALPSRATAAGDVALDRHRDVMLSTCEGITDEQLRRPMVPSGTSVLGLVKHLVRVEYGWFRDTFGWDSEAVAVTGDDPDADLHPRPWDSTPGPDQQIRYPRSGRRRSATGGVRTDGRDR